MARDRMLPRDHHRPRSAKAGGYMRSSGSRPSIRVIGRALTHRDQQPVGPSYPIGQAGGSRIGVSAAAALAASGPPWVTTSTGGSSPPSQPLILMRARKRSRRLS